MEKTEKKKHKKEFQDFFLFSSIPNMKTGMWATLALFILFRLVTLIFFGDSELNTYFLRFKIIFPFIIATLVFLYIKALHKWLHTLLTWVTLLSGAAIFFIGASSDINNPGYQYYRIWVMLVIMGTFVFYRISFRNLMFIGGILILSYVLACIYNNFVFESPLLFTVNLFFLISIGSLGYFVAIFRQQSIYRIFLQKQELDAKNEKLLNEIQQKEISEKALRESEMQYLSLVDSIPDALFVLDEDLRFVMINEMLKKLHTRLNLEQDAIGKKATDIYEFGTNERWKEIRNVFITGIETIKENSYLINGITINTETRFIPVFSDNKVIRVMVIVRDISKKIEVEQLKLKNLQQKEILLREIHHRVKNNLAIVISLLDMQIRTNQNKEFIALSREIEYRIRSMALIHEHLYNSDELDKVPLCKYLVAISNGVSRCFGSPRIRTVFNCDLTDIKIEIAMPIGLIFNEILTNACKYAFPDERNGEILVNLKQEDNEPGLYRLSVHDNGVGLPPGFSLDDPTSMGLMIIKLLSDQISARLIIENQEGTTFNLTFKNMVSEY